MAAHHERGHAQVDSKGEWMTVMHAWAASSSGGWARTGRGLGGVAGKGEGGSRGRAVLVEESVERGGGGGGGVALAC